MRKRKIFIFLSLFILFISTIFTLKIKISFKKYVDSYFIVSALITSCLLFKLLLEKGLFITLGYSWYKTKMYILPKTQQKELKNISFNDYLTHKESKKSKNLNILIYSSLFHLFLSTILSLFIYFYINH